MRQTIAALIDSSILAKLGVARLESLQVQMTIQCFRDQSPDLMSVTPQVGAQYLQEIESVLRQLYQAGSIDPYEGQVTLIYSLKGSTAMPEEEKSALQLFHQLRPLGAQLLGELERVLADLPTVTELERLLRVEVERITSGLIKQQHHVLVRPQWRVLGKCGYCGAFEAVTRGLPTVSPEHEILIYLITGAHTDPFFTLRRGLLEAAAAMVLPRVAADVLLRQLRDWSNFLDLLAVEEGQRVVFGPIPPQKEGGSSVAQESTRLAAQVHVSIDDSGDGENPPPDTPAPPSEEEEPLSDESTLDPSTFDETEERSGAVPAPNGPITLSGDGSDPVYTGSYGETALD